MVDFSLVFLLIAVSGVIKKLVFQPKRGDEPVKIVGSRCAVKARSEEVYR